MKILMKVLTAVLIFIGLFGGCCLDSDVVYLPVLFMAIGFGGAFLTWLLFWRNVYEA